MGYKYPTPNELIPQHIMDRTGWDIFTLRATPDSEIQKMLMYWHLVDLADESGAKKVSKG